MRSKQWYTKASRRPKSWVNRSICHGRWWNFRRWPVGAVRLLLIGLSTPDHHRPWPRVTAYAGPYAVRRWFPGWRAQARPTLLPRTVELASGPEWDHRPPAPQRGAVIRPMEFPFSARRSTSHIAQESAHFHPPHSSGSKTTCSPTGRDSDFRRAAVSPRLFDRPSGSNSYRARARGSVETSRRLDC
jgi:hypothetical protein